MKQFRAIVKRGTAAGTVLRPHRHADGNFVVSMTRLERDCIRVADETALPEWIARGYRVRMSNPAVPTHRSPSLIAPGSIEVE